MSEPNSYQLAKSYRKGQQQRPFTIKMKDCEIIIAEEVKTCWTDYFLNLLNVDTQENDEIGEMLPNYMNL